MHIKGTEIPSGAAAAPAESKGTAASAKDQFLQLLVAQISHQDPMNPMDDKALVQQLAQFTGVEQAIETNTRLAALQEGASAQSRLSMTSLIGKQASASTRMVHHSNGAPAPQLAFKLPADASRVTVNIVNRLGNIVRSFDAGAKTAGMQSVAWDGKSGDGGALMDGDYMLQVDAKDAHGKAINVGYEVTGSVTGVDLTGPDPTLSLSGVRVRSKDITQINTQTTL